MMPTQQFVALTGCLVFTLAGTPADAQSDFTFFGQEDHAQHSAHGKQHGDHAGQAPDWNPSLPEGMTLDEVLDLSAEPSPFAPPISDNDIYSFILLEQVEYRLPEEGADRIGWEGQGWIGYDYDKFWWKTEGEYEFEGTDSGEAENDLLYSRLITPFWNLQFGVQYANTWGPGNDSDTWSGVIALQGLAPGSFEVDMSLYLSENADVTLATELEYNIRITQRLILQPRMEFTLSAQDIPSQGIGAGLTSTNLDLRLQYEIERRFTPYIGVRYSFLSGETADMAAAMGNDREQLFLVAGLRWAF